MTRKPVSQLSAKPELIAEGRYLAFYRREGWEFVRRKNCTGIVVMVPLTDEGRVVFVEQHRVPLGKRVIEFPAGLVGDRPGDSRETTRTAARRELLEETGYWARSLRPAAKGPISSGLTSESLEFWIAKRLIRKGPGGGDENENILVHEVPLESAESWLRKKEKKGFLVDPKIYAGLYWLHRA